MTLYLILCNIGTSLNTIIMKKDYVTKHFKFYQDDLDRLEYVLEYMKAKAIGRKDVDAVRYSLAVAASLVDKGGDII